MHNMRGWWVPVGMVAVWSAWILWQAWWMNPSHDEIITLLNMVNNTAPDWTAIARPAEHLRQMSGEIIAYGDVAGMLLRTDVHPPAYYYLAVTVSHIFGPNLFALRVVSWLATVLAIGVVARTVVRTAPGPWAGPVVVALLLVSPAVAYAALPARSYGLLFLEAAVFFAAAVAFVRRPHAPWWPVLVMVVSGLLGVWTHYFAVFLITPVVVWLGVYTARQARSAAKAWVVLVVAGVLGCLPLLGWVRVHMGARDHQYAGFKGWAVETFGLLRTVLEQLVFVPRSALALWVLLVGILGLGVVCVQVRRTGALPPVVWLSVATVVGGFVGIGGLFWATDKSLLMADTRYGIILLPTLLMVVGWVAHRRVGRWAALSLVVLALPSWVVHGGPGYEPWVSDGYYEKVAAVLSRPDALVLTTVDSRHHGTIAGMMYRAPSGYVGVARSPEQAQEIVRAVPEDVRTVHLYTFAETIGFESGWQADLMATLAAEGFVAQEGGGWARR